MIAAMRSLIAEAQIGDAITVRDTGGEHTYTVTGHTGSVARELDLVGARGAKRRLIDGAHTIWLQRQTKRGLEYRRVIAAWSDSTCNEPVGAPSVFDDREDLTALTQAGPSSAPSVDHPTHYGGADDPFEAIKVIDAWRLGFSLGNVVKYIARAGRKDPAKLIEDLEKARWYLDHEISRLQGKS